jgi:plastocyanin
MRAKNPDHPRSSPLKAGRVIVAAVAILTVLVLVAACGSSGDTTTTGTPGTTGSGGAQVTIKDFAFDPTSVTIKAGESVTWTNQDSAGHTVAGDNNEFESGDLAKGASFRFTFDKAGTYTYHCGIHPTMKGTVVVE